MGIKVVLSDDEALLAEDLALRRYHFNRGTKITDHLATDRDAVSNDIEAIGAEFAVAKHYNAFPSLNWRKGRDDFDLILSGHKVDVKWSPTANMNVRVVAHKDVEYFIGVTGSMPNYEIVGSLSVQAVEKYPIKEGRNDTKYRSILSPTCSRRTRRRHEDRTLQVMSGPDRVAKNPKTDRWCPSMRSQDGLHPARRRRQRQPLGVATIYTPHHATCPHSEQWHGRKDLA